MLDACAGGEVEEGWEQAGRNESSRSNRSRGRGSATPQIMQRQDRPSNAWGQQGSAGPTPEVKPCIIYILGSA